MFALILFLSGLLIFWLVKFFLAKENRLKFKYAVAGALTLSMIIGLVSVQNFIRNQKIEKVLAADMYLNPNSCVKDILVTSKSKFSERFYIAELNYDDAHDAHDVFDNHEHKDSLGHEYKEIHGDHSHSLDDLASCSNYLGADKVYYNIAEGYIAVKDDDLYLSTTGLLVDGMVENQKEYSFDLLSKSDYSELMQSAFELAVQDYRILYQKELLTEETKTIFMSSKKMRKEYDKDYISYSKALDEKKVLVVEVPEERKSDILSYAETHSLLNQIVLIVEDKAYRIQNGVFAEME